MSLKYKTDDLKNQPMQHPSGIAEKIVKKVVARRGRLHTFESIEPCRTALVVVDLDTATVGSNEECRRVVPRVNELAVAVRRTGGAVAWVTSHMLVMPRHFAAILGSEPPDPTTADRKYVARGVECQLGVALGTVGSN